MSVILDRWPATVRDCAKIAFLQQAQLLPLCGTLVSRVTMQNGLNTLLTSSLRLNAGEHLAFVYDQEFTSLVEPIRRLCGEYGVDIRAVSIDYDGIQPLPQEIKDLILGHQYGILLFAVVHNIWHTSERKRAKYELKKRLASIVCAPGRLHQSGPVSSIPLIGSAARRLSSVLSTGGKVHVTSPAGCDFTAVVGIPFCEDGEYDRPGTGGDFPAGEVGFGPQESSVAGRIVYDVKVQHLGLLESPLVLTVQRDKVTDVTGHYRQAFIDLRDRRGTVLDYISEISLGLNPFVGITPEPAFIPEEKTYGTAHCGHGGNASYGRRVGAHIDGVINSPTIEIDGVTVMENGRIRSGFLDKDVLDWLHDSYASNEHSTN